MDAASHDAVQGAAAVLTPVGVNSVAVLPASGATNLEGEFMLNNIVAGRYELRVSRTGYTNYSTTVNVRYQGRQKFSIALSRSVIPCAPTNPGRKPAQCP